MHLHIKVFASGPYKILKCSLYPQVSKGYVNLAQQKCTMGYMSETPKDIKYPGTTQSHKMWDIVQSSEDVFFPDCTDLYGA